MYKAYDNGQGGIAHECVPDDYVAKPGEVLFADCPSEAEKAAAVPVSSRPPAREKTLAEEIGEIKARLDAAEAENAKLRQALVAKAVVSEAEIAAAGPAKGPA